MRKNVTKENEKIFTSRAFWRPSDPSKMNNSCNDIGTSFLNTSKSHVSIKNLNKNIFWFQFFSLNLVFVCLFYFHSFSLSLDLDLDFDLDLQCFFDIKEMFAFFRVSNVLKCFSFWNIQFNNFLIFLPNSSRQCFSKITK